MENEDSNIETPEKTFTQEEVDKMITERLSKAERSRDKAIKDALDAYKAEADARAKADAEAARIAGLQGEERLKAEHEAKMRSMQDKYDAQRAEYESVRRELSISRAQAQLAEIGLPSEFAENLLGEDDSQTRARIDAFSKAFNDAVNARVAEGLHKGTPPAGGLSSRQAAEADLDRIMGISR